MHIGLSREVEATVHVPDESNEDRIDAYSSREEGFLEWGSEEAIVSQGHTV